MASVKKHLHFHLKLTNLNHDTKKKKKEFIYIPAKQFKESKNIHLCKCGNVLTTIYIRPLTPFPSMIIDRHPSKI